VLISDRNRRHEPTETTAIARICDFAETLDQLFEPVPLETIAGLLTEHAERLGDIDRVVEFFSGALHSILPYFIDGNCETERRYSAEVLARDLFKRDGAMAALNAAFWSRAMGLTDIYDSMPQKRRDEWNADIEHHKTPPFDPTTVMATLKGLLAMRKKYFSERVDGVFEVLSPDHKTNKASGFNKRLIINYVWNGWMVDSSRAGYINDLRSVIARFMGRDEPNAWRSTEPMIKAALEQRGSWLAVDGGAMRIRCYKKGTAHIEIHPEIVWRLNNVLASLHPSAIASEHMVRPTRQPKGFELFGRPLPFKVLEVLHHMEVRRSTKREGEWTLTRSYHDKDLGKVVLAEAGRVVEGFGGVSQGKSTECWTIDYDPKEVIQSIVVTGCVPDHVAHQYYPTPPELAARVVAAAEIGENHECLEPSAGQGALADLMPLDRTICVEVSALHCAILRAKKHRVAKADFLKWKPRKRFDRCAMNPPFSEGRWVRHLEHAASLMGQDGRIVAVLPASARNRKGLLPGWNLSWSEKIEFPGTSIEVVVLTATREQ
jgi:hypothetical protein